MFLVRSVRRRLVLLLGFALLLMSALAGIGVCGLIWHQEAVDDLDFLLHQSPNLDHLSRAVARINESLFNSLDLKQAAAVETLRADYRKQIKDAETELFDFRRKFEAQPLTPELTLQRDQVLIRLDGVYRELAFLSSLADGLKRTKTDEDIIAIHQLKSEAASAVTAIQKSLDNLPAFQTHNRVEQSLQKERERSGNLLTALMYTTGTVGVFFIAITACGLKWISEPARKVANGCTRIANGDIRYRLGEVSRWQDEFSDLVAGVNCMADRFQQSEEDLLHKVKERSEQLVRSQKLVSVGYLAAGVAHEINNPLSAITMAADSLEYRLDELLGMDSEDAREALDRIAMIRRESRRCGDITARLLDFSRGEKAGKQTEDIATLVRDVLTIVRHLGQFSDRHVEFDCDRLVTAEVNAAQIKQEILNLVANALQASPPGGVVTIRLQEQVDTVVLSVSDEGCGMDAETLQHIFDPFFTTKEVGQGTGLGLSITHRMVEDHHGTVTPLSDGNGCGSTFQIRLPRRQPRADAA